MLTLFSVSPSCLEAFIACAWSGGLCQKRVALLGVYSRSSAPGTSCLVSVVLPPVASSDWLTTLSARSGENRERPLTPKHFPHNRYTFRVLPISGRSDVNTFRKCEGKADHAQSCWNPSLNIPFATGEGIERTKLGYDCYRCLKLRVCDWHEKRVRSGEAICPFFVWALITTGQKFGVCDRQWLQKCITMSIFVGWLPMLLYVHRNCRLIRDGSPGRPLRLSHSSRTLHFCAPHFTFKP